MQFFFKYCPRCSGDVVKDRDTYGPYLMCLPCGWLKDVKEAVSKSNGGQSQSSIVSSEPINKSIGTPNLDDYVNVLRVLYDRGKPERLRSLTPDIKLPEKTIEDSLYTMKDYEWMENKLVPSSGRAGASNMFVITDAGRILFELIKQKNNEYDNLHSIRSENQSEICNLMDGNKQLTERGKYVVGSIEELALFVEDKYQITINDSEVSEETLEEALLHAR